MEKEKVIEQLKNDITECYGCDPMYYGTDGDFLARGLVGMGWRKQKEGEWQELDICAEDMYCSVCGGIAAVDCEKEAFYKSNYCPTCGAHMKGGAE